VTVSSGCDFHRHAADDLPVLFGHEEVAQRIIHRLQAAVQHAPTLGVVIDDVAYGDGIRHSCGSNHGAHSTETPPGRAIEMGEYGIADCEFTRCAGAVATVFVATPHGAMRSHPTRLGARG
jgi:hypothetical protein